MYGARTSIGAQAAPVRSRSRAENGLRHHGIVLHAPHNAVHSAGGTDSGRQRNRPDDGQYVVPLFGGARQVFRYLGRYSHRVAISNHRLRQVTDTHVQFDWKDYAGGNQVRQMRLDIDEFIRRFLLHVLPKGFVRIRHYGLLASINVAGKLERCRRLLEGNCKPKPTTAAKTWIERVLEWTGQDMMACPRCQGPLTRRELLDPCNRGATPARFERTANGQQTVPTNSS
jgi:hypothetical protein